MICAFVTGVQTSALPIYGVFPKSQNAGIRGGHFLISRILPGPTPTTSTTIQTILTGKKPVTEEEIASCVAFSELAREAVGDEDYPIGFGLTRGLASGANTAVVVGGNSQDGKSDV